MKPVDLYVLVGTARAGLKDAFPVILCSDDEDGNVFCATNLRDTRRILRWVWKQPYFNKWRPIRVVRYRATGSVGG